MVHNGEICVHIHACVMLSSRIEMFNILKVPFLGQCLSLRHCVHTHTFKKKLFPSDFNALKKERIVMQWKVTWNCIESHMIHSVGRFEFDDWNVLRDIFGCEVFPFSRICIISTAFDDEPRTANTLTRPMFMVAVLRFICKFYKLNPIP